MVKALVVKEDCWWRMVRMVVMWLIRRRWVEQYDGGCGGGRFDGDCDGGG